MNYSGAAKYKGAILKSFIVVTLILVAIMFIGSVDPNELIGIWKYILISFAIVLIQLMVKGIRFYYICRVFTGEKIPLSRALLIRISSEFFSLIGVSYVGDEAFRIYILNKKHDIDLGTASVMGYLEVLSEVVVAVGIVMLGIVYLVINNILNTIVYVLIAATLAVSGFHFILVYRTAAVKRLVDKIINKLRFLIGDERVERYIMEADKAFQSFEKGLDIGLGRKTVFLNILLSTVATALLGGASLWILAYPLGISMDIFGAIIVLHMSLVLSSLPITISGSGLFELVILLFGREFSDKIPWLLPIAFRVSSYYLPLILTIVLVYRVFDKYNIVA